MSSGADLRVAYVAESTFGTTPATPSFQNLRVTSGGLKTTKQTTKSEELRNDGNVIDELQVGQDVEGSYPFELSYGSFDELIALAVGGAWSSDVLKNGADLSYLTFEETIEQGATDTFRRFVGCAVSGMELKIASREVITGSFNIMGKQETLAEAAITGATYAASNTKPIMVAGASVGAISVGSLTNECIAGLTLNIERNLRARHCVGSIYSSEFVNKAGADITGQARLYFKDKSAWEAMLAHETAAISATIGHDANEKYTISIPRARWTEGSTPIGGRGDDIMVDMPFRATLSNDHSLQITRAVA